MKTFLVYLILLAGAAIGIGLVVKFWVLKDDPPPRQATTRPDRRGQRTDRPRAAGEFGFHALEPGLDMGVWQTSTDTPEASESRLHVLRVDPTKFELRLLMASASSPATPLTARQWCERETLVAAIPAGLAGADGKSLSLMQSRRAVNNPKRSAEQGLIAFDPLDRTTPPLFLGDMDGRSAKTRKKYGAAIQGPRLIGPGREVWAGDLATRRASIAAIGADTGDRLLLLHCRLPYTLRQFAELLPKLTPKLHLRSLVLAELGPRAQLFVDANGKGREFVGSLDSAGRPDNATTQPATVFNVIGIARKPATP